jgi:tRNA modification GTPase
LRNDPDRIEAEGIRRAREALAQADAALWIQDATETEQEEPREKLPDGLPVTVVHNKIDLSGDKPGLIDGEVYLSAQTGEGVDALRRRIKHIAGYENQGEGAFTARRRHIKALERAAGHFATGRVALEEARAGELLAEELRLSQRALGEIVGNVTADDLLGRIFSEFCIGK